MLGSQGKLELAEEAARQAVKLRAGQRARAPDPGLHADVPREACEAEKELREAQRLDPDEAETLARLGECAAEQGKLDEAIGFWTEAKAARSHRCGHSRPPGGCLRQEARPGTGAARTQRSRAAGPGRRELRTDPLAGLRRLARNAAGTGAPGEVRRAGAQRRPRAQDGGLHGSSAGAN